MCYMVCQAIVDDWDWACDRTLGPKRKIQVIGVFYVLCNAPMLTHEYIIDTFLRKTTLSYISIYN